MTSIIYLFGPSCGGKSTLGKALQKSLGREWSYVARDDLIEQGLCSDSTANKALEERVRLIKDKIIIDAQIPWKKKEKGELYFLVFPPLQILLERDAVRTLRLNRSPQQAGYARAYVVETHQTLNKIEKTQFDCCFDSSQTSVENEINTIKTFLYRSSKPVSHLKYIGLAISGITFSLVLVLILSQQKSS